MKEIIRRIMEIGEVPMLVGPAGVGKTDVMKQIAKETGRDLVILILSQMEPGDLIGMPDRKDGKTVFLKPEWWPENGNAIIFLDEINRAHRSIRAAIMQLLIDKRINGHVLPDGVWIAAAMNPATDDYDVDEIFDAAFVDRFVWLKFAPGLEQWLAWAQDNDLPQWVMNLAIDMPELSTVDANFPMPEIKPTRRAMVRCAKVLSALNKKTIEKHGFEIAAGIVGPHAANTFVKYALGKVKYRVTIDDVLKNFAKVKDILPKLEKDEVMAIVTRLAMRVREGNVTLQEAENAGRFLLNIPKEMAIVFERLAMNDDTMRSQMRKLMKNKKFAEAIGKACAGFDKTVANEDDFDLDSDVIVLTNDE